MVLVLTSGIGIIRWKGVVSVTVGIENGTVVAI